MKGHTDYVNCKNHMTHFTILPRMLIVNDREVLPPCGQNAYYLICRPTDCRFQHKRRSVHYPHEVSTESLFIFPTHSYISILSVSKKWYPRTSQAFQSRLFPIEIRWGESEQIAPGLCSSFLSIHSEGYTRNTCVQFMYLVRIFF